MFIEYYMSDWLLLFSNFIWILGAAIILAVFSYHEFLIWQQKIRRKEIFRRSSFKKSFFLGLILFIAGLVFSSFNFNEYSSSSKFIFIDNNIYESEEIKIFDIRESLNISARKLEMSKKYSVNNNLISMITNGYVRTPFIKFPIGHYIVEFEAYGSEANDKFSKIFVAFLVLKEKKLVLQNLFKIIDLTDTKKKYTHKFENKENQIGKIRIQFFNDYWDGKSGDRNVWIGGMKIMKLKRSNSDSK